jgi:hypothetical protein
MNAVMSSNTGARTGRVGAMRPSTRESSSLHPLDLVDSDGVIEAF